MRAARNLAVAVTATLLLLPGAAARSEPLVLSEAEREWVSRHPVIRIAFDGFFPPYSFLGDDGRFEGLAVDVANLLAARAGLTLEVHSEALWKDLYAAAQRREVDVVATMVDRPERAEWFLFTRPYIHKSLVVMTREDGPDIRRRADLAGRRIALVRGYQYVPRLLAEFPTLEPHYVDTMIDGLNDVATGAADGAITFLGAGHFLRARYQLANLRFSAVYDRDASFESFGVRRDWPELVAILDKALAAIRTQELFELKSTWKSDETLIASLAPKPFLGRRAALALIGVLTLALLVSGAAILWNRALRARVRQRTAELRRELENRVSAETALRRSEARLRTILASTCEAIIAVDRDGRVTSWNDAARRIFGYEKEEILGRNISLVIPQNGMADHEKRLSQTREESFVPGHEAVWLAKDGRLVPVETSFGLMRDQDGSEAGYSAVVSDLTGIKERERFIQDVFRSMGEGLAVIGPDYRILAVNPAYAAMFGVDLDAIVGKPCHEVAHGTAAPCEKPDAACPVRETFSTGEAATANHVHHAPAGAVVQTLVRSYPMRDALGKVTAVIEILRDVTGERKLEEQLRQAQKMESVGQLAGGVAHDFNNLLGVVMGHASLIETAAENQRQKLSAREILAACERGARLTHSLLAFCRKQVVEAKPVMLEEIIGSSMRLLTRVIGEDIEIRTSLRDGASTILADPGLIEQVLMNLATNARDAMPDGGVLSIDTERTVIDAGFVQINGYGIEGQYALITVSDTGVGMDAATQARAFEPFFTTKEVGRGTGLGLAMVYGTVRQHGGFIHLASEPGLRTTFRIYLPLVPGPAAAGAESPRPVPPGGDETILLAEDDPALRLLTREALERAGYTVVEAADGEEAVARFREHGTAIQLLLLDVILPKANGREVLERIGREKPAVKVLFVSGYPAELLQRKGALGSEFPLLTKPLRMDELLRRVREVLDAPT